MLAIIKYIKENGLEKAISDFKLISKDYGYKILLKYSQIESNMSLKEVQECRGLILEKDTWRIMNLSFFKFFNAQEGHAAKIDWDSARILYKLDGSLIQLMYDYHKNKWFAATSGMAEGEGSVDSLTAMTFHELFMKTVIEKYGFNECLLNKDNTYVFELCTPWNLIVTPHTTSSATLLTVRNLKTLKEYSYDEVKMIGISLGVPVIESVDLNAKDSESVIKTLEGMSWEKEGYVVVDDNFNRIKIKNPAYLAVHRLKDKTAQHNILTIIKTNEIDEFAAVFAERREELYRLKAKYDNLISKLEDIWNELKLIRPIDISPAERKRYALAVKDIVVKYDVVIFTGMFFMLNDNKVASVKDYLFNFDDKQLYNIL